VGVERLSRASSSAEHTRLRMSTFALSIQIWDNSRLSHETWVRTSAPSELDYSRLLRRFTERWQASRQLELGRSVHVLPQQTDKCFKAWQHNFPCFDPAKFLAVAGRIAKRSEARTLSAQDRYLPQTGSCLPLARL